MSYDHVTNLRKMFISPPVLRYANVLDKDSSAVSTLESLMDMPETWDFVLHRLQTAGMTDEERTLKSFTHRNLKKFANWPDWCAAFLKQLDAHHAAGTLVEPILHSEALEQFCALGICPNILHFQWSSLVKATGTRKARACTDGSKHFAPLASAT